MSVKHLRHIAFAVLLSISALSLVLIVSCKNKCGTTTCQNGGTCTDNKCVCPIGYSGNSCQTAWTDKFVGTYNCSRGTCTPATTGATTWVSAITKNSTDGGESILISDFASSNTTVTATVDTNGKMIFAPAAGSYGISGDGTLTVSSAGITSINVHYTLSTASGAGAYTCDLTMVKE